MLCVGDKVLAVGKTLGVIPQNTPGVITDIVERDNETNYEVSFENSLSVNGYKLGNGWWMLSEELQKVD